MQLNSIIYTFKEACYMRSLVRRYGDSLAPGNYLLFENFRFLSLDSQKNSAEKFFGNKSTSPKKAKFIRWLNKTQFFRNAKKNTSAEYEALYSANNFDAVREVKLFSFKRKKILIVCTSAEEAEAQLSLYDTLSFAYPLPRVDKKGLYPNSLEISMVESHPLPDERLAVEAIAGATMRAVPDGKVSASQTVKEWIAFSYENQEMNDILQEMASGINPALLDLSLPFSIQHGDLSRENLLYGTTEGKTDFWWIDWEHKEERPFFYDLFFYIVHSAMHFGANTLTCYLRGDWDALLKQAFSHFQLSFSPNHKKDYLLVFMIGFLKERVCAFHRIEALRYFRDFIKKHFGDENEA